MSPYWCVSVVAVVDSVSSRSLVFAAAASGVHTFPVIHFGTRLAVERRSLYGAVVTFVFRLDALYVRYTYICVTLCTRFLFFFRLTYIYIYICIYIYTELIYFESFSRASLHLFSPAFTVFSIFFSSRRYLRGGDIPVDRA